MDYSAQRRGLSRRTPAYFCEPRDALTEALAEARAACALLPSRIKAGKMGRLAAPGKSFSGHILNKSFSCSLLVPRGGTSGWGSPRTLHLALVLTTFDARLPIPLLSRRFRCLGSALTRTCLPFSASLPDGSWLRRGGGGQGQGRGSGHAGGGRRKRGRGLIMLLLPRLVNTVIGVFLRCWLTAIFKRGKLERSSRTIHYLFKPALLPAHDPTDNFAPFSLSFSVSSLSLFPFFRSFTPGCRWAAVVAVVDAVGCSVGLFRLFHRLPSSLTLLPPPLLPLFLCLPHPPFCPPLGPFSHPPFLLPLAFPSLLVLLSVLPILSPSLFPSPSLPLSAFFLSYFLSHHSSLLLSSLFLNSFSSPYSSPSFPSLHSFFSFLFSIPLSLSFSPSPPAVPTPAYIFVLVAKYGKDGPAIAPSTTTTTTTVETMAMTTTTTMETMAMTTMAKR